MRLEVVGYRIILPGMFRYKCPLCLLLQVPKAQPVALITSPEDSQHYEEARQCVEELALYLKPLSNTRGTNTHSALDTLVGGRF